MLEPKELLQFFARNWDIIQAQTKGLSNDQCLLQPPFRGNCMNWCLGHIADTRNTLLLALGQRPIMTKDEAARYSHGSEPVCADGPDIIPLEPLLSMLQRSQDRLAEALPALTTADLAKKITDHRGETTLANRIFFLYFHETYHVGQTELLRQLAGTDDKII